MKEQRKNQTFFMACTPMEGFVVLPEYKALCEKLLNKEITMAE